MNDAPENMPDRSEQVEGLRRHVGLLFGALIISSFTLTAYLGLQGRRASEELLAARYHEANAIKVIDQDDAAAKSLYDKLVEFGRTHPDFQKQILSRYTLNAGTNAPTK